MLEIAVEYYTQRATFGGLQITEGTFISEEAGGYEYGLILRKVWGG